jgi:DNA polymerase III psi subunit
MRSNPPIPNLTAVEWLVQKYFNDYNVLIPELEYEQAKQMEKEQIVNAWMATDNELQRLAAEQYYNETYGNKS